MTWGFVGAAAVTVGATYLQGSQAAGAAAGSIDDQNEAVIRHNKRIVEANVENASRTAYRVGLLNLQQGQAKRNLLQQGFDLTVGGQQVLGAVSANAAASGTIGASTQAVEADVRQKLGEAQNQLSEGWDLQLMNFNTELNSILESGGDALSRADGTVAKSSISESDIINNALLAGAASFASNYAMRSMSLGLGNRPTSTGQAGGTGLSLGGGTGLRTGGGQGFR